MPAYQKSDHHLILTKLKYLRNMYTNLEVTSSSGICKTIYHNGSCLMLFGKRKLQSFEILCE